LLNPKDALWQRAAPPVFRVRISTTRGPFTIEAHRDWAPHGADRFYHLAQAGFYDDSRFFRVIPGDFAQFGIAGNPEIAAVWRNAAMPDDPVTQSNTRGFVAFAMTGPDARTTQIYIVTGDRSRQDKDGFAPFGRVVDWMDVVDKLYSGYGESSGGGMRAGKQVSLFERGNAHLDKEFPKLDRLVSAAVM